MDELPRRARRGSGLHGKRPPLGWYLARGALALLLVLAPFRTNTQGAECTTAICSGTSSSCTITGSHTLTAPCVTDPCGTPSCTCTLDFGQKDVTIGGTGVLKVPNSGCLTIIAGDLTVKGNIDAAGGFVDVRLAGNGSSTLGRFTATGSALITVSDPPDNGGGVEITAPAGGSVKVLQNARIRANGLGSIDICVGARDSTDQCDETGTGEVTIQSTTGDGSPEISASNGGFMTIVGGSINVPTSATELDVSDNDPDDSGGDIQLRASAGDITANGTVTANDPKSDADGGAIVLLAPGNHAVLVGGVLKAQGGTGDFAGDGMIFIGNNPPGIVCTPSGCGSTQNTALPGCSISISGTVDSEGPTRSGENEFWYRGSYTSLSTAVIRAGDPDPSGGAAFNHINCRSTDFQACASPPSLGGTYDPAPDNVPEPLGPCTGCGNGVVEAGEQCDDGNVNHCDGCGLNCTPEFNGGPCDDGNPCTVNDTCTGQFCGGGCFDAPCPCNLRCRVTNTGCQCM
jgi:cysteine-rich repeat protein